MSQNVFKCVFKSCKIFSKMYFSPFWSQIWFSIWKSFNVPFPFYQGPFHWKDHRHMIRSNHLVNALASSWNLWKNYYIKVTVFKLKTMHIWKSKTTGKKQQKHWKMQSLCMLLCSDKMCRWYHTIHRQRVALILELPCQVSYQKVM